MPGIRNVGNVALLVIGDHSCLQGQLLPAIFFFLLCREKWISQGTLEEGRATHSVVSHSLFCSPRFVIKQCDTVGKQEPIAVRSKAPGSPISSMSADQASSSPLLPLNSGEFSRGDLNHQGDANTSEASLGSGPKPADAQTKQSTKESASAPFVPFSGGGQRLGGPSGSLRSLTSHSAKSLKSSSGSGGPSKPKKSKPGEEPQQEPEPVRSILRPGAFS